MQTKTKSVNEAMKNILKKENDLLSAGAYELIRGINEINPIFYYHRMLAKLFPDSDFSRELNENYSRNDKSVITKRNKLVDEAMKDNIPRDIRKNDLFPLVDFKKCSDDGSIWDSLRTMLTRNNASGINATGLTREKLFLCAFVFNLDFDTLLDLMSRCIGEQDLNYKNPYEVLLAYCAIEHNKVCERFIEIKKIYEQKRSLCSLNDNNIKTKVAKEKFSNIQDDDSLVEFMCTLPSAEKTSPKEVLKDIYNDVKSVFSIEYELYTQTYPNCSEYKYVTNAIYGDDIKIKEGYISFIKKLAFSYIQLEEMINGTRAVTKSALMILLFYRYVCFDEENTQGENTAWSECVKYCQENNIENPLLYLYEDFKSILNPILEDAGFSEIYLPNVLERLLTYCLITKDPIETFQVAFSCENVTDIIGGE